MSLPLDSLAFVPKYYVNFCGLFVLIHPQVLLILRSLAFDNTPLTSVGTMPLHLPLLIIVPLILSHYNNPILLSRFCLCSVGSS